MPLFRNGLLRQLAQDRLDAHDEAEDGPMTLQRLTQEILDDAEENYRMRGLNLATVMLVIRLVFMLWKATR